VQSKEKIWKPPHSPPQKKAPPPHFFNPQGQKPTILTREELVPESQQHPRRVPNNTTGERKFLSGHSSR